MPTSRKRRQVVSAATAEHIEIVEDHLPKRKRLTRSAYGSTVDIPIILDSSSDSDSSTDELEKLEQVLANGRILAVARKKNKITRKNSANRRNEKTSVVENIKSPITQRKYEHEKIAEKQLSESSGPNDAAHKEDTTGPSDKGVPLKELGNEELIESQRSKRFEIEPGENALTTKTDKEIILPLKQPLSTVPSFNSLNSEKLSLELGSKPLIKSVLKKAPSHAGPSSPPKIAKRVMIDNTIAKISSSVSTPIRRLKISVPNRTRNYVANFKRINGTQITGANMSTADTTEIGPSNQKLFRDTYSVSCISCTEKNKTNDCNKQKPCDICLTKQFSNCSYPPDATVAVPSVKIGLDLQKSESLNPPAKVIANTEINKDKVSSRRPDSSVLERMSNEANSPALPNNKSSPQSVKAPAENSRLNHESKQLPSAGNIVEKKIRNQKIRRRKRIVDSSDDDAYDNDGSKSEAKNDDTDSVADYEDNKTEGLVSSEDSHEYSDNEDGSETNFENDGDYDDDEGGDDDNDDDDDGAIERRRRQKDKRRDRNRFISPRDNFTRAQKILKELEFEKRDIDDIYVPNGRKKRNATKENYYIPSDLEEEADDVNGNGYAAAEARNEQLILSEDEQERRILRGEIGLDYIKSLRTEREKHNHHLSDESLSSSDSEQSNL